MTVNSRRLIALYPRQWRERYGDELLALMDDKPVSARDGADLLANCAREWSRTLHLGRMLLPLAGGFAANGVGWFLQDTFGRVTAIDTAFPKFIWLWLAVWLFVCVRLAPSYWRWLSAPLHRQPPPLARLSPLEARCFVAIAVIVGIVIPWNTNLPREWWSFASNPFFSTWAVLQNVIWPLPDSSAVGSTVAFSKRPPTHPLGLA